VNERLRLSGKGRRQRRVGEARAEGLVLTVCGRCHLASGWRCWVGRETIPRWKRGPRGQAPQTRGDSTCALPIYMNGIYSAKKAHGPQLVR
jgi:hypothetical protein